MSMLIYCQYLGFDFQPATTVMFSTMTWKQQMSQGHGDTQKHSLWTSVTTYNSRKHGWPLVKKNTYHALKKEHHSDTCLYIHVYLKIFYVRIYSETCLIWEKFLCQNRQGVQLNRANKKEQIGGNENQHQMKQWNRL